MGQKIFLGIGIDIEEVARFRNFLIQKKAPLLGRIFTKKELAYCFFKKNPAEHLAVRFAAKEAVIKAISSISGSRIAPHFYKEIEIKNNKYGSPSVIFGSKTRKNMTIKISLSHTNNQVAACAVVLGR